MLSLLETDECAVPDWPHPEKTVIVGPNRGPIHKVSLQRVNEAPTIVGGALLVLLSLLQVSGVDDLREPFRFESELNSSNVNL